jgi:uncharacterized protein YyaL (SSP411 family)
LATPKEIVIVGSRTASDTQLLLRCVYETYLPNKILLVIDPASDTGDAYTHLPVDEMIQSDGKATAYVCHNFACSIPTTTPEGLAELLK